MSELARLMPQGGQKGLPSRSRPDSTCTIVRTRPRILPQRGVETPAYPVEPNKSMVRSGTRSPALRRTLGQAGYTLIETLVVMTLLVIVIGALADGFTSASKTETDQVSRTDDQEAARQALERMRTDIHCASSALVGPTLDS